MMFRTCRLSSFVVPLALVAVLTLTCERAEAQARPFKVKGEGNAPDGLSLLGLDSSYTASGTATHLGKYSGFGIARVTGMDKEPAVPNAVFTGSFTGGFVFVAANGDKLVCEHPGTFAVYFDGVAGLYAVFDAIFSPTTLTIDDTSYASTGRFANADGSFRMIATTESFNIDFLVGATTAFDFEWQGEGSFSFPR